MPGKIEDYALIGDLQTAALVGRDGSVAWLCLPRFDSPSCFAALLGGPGLGRWRLAPVGGTTCTHRGYRGDTLVLESVWETPGGSARVIDFMPQRDRAPDLVRIVEGLSGSVEMRSELAWRFDYGRVVPWVRHTDGHRVAIAGPDSVWLRTDGEVHTYGHDMRTWSECTVRAGERASFVMTWQSSHLGPPRVRDPLKMLVETVEDWEHWAGALRYRGPWRDAVLRSMITLKTLTYAPTGGIVAAATTGLPELIGGQRNWDYRYCWLRDATLTLAALLRGGFQEEARAWRDWLLRAIAGDPADLQTVYGVAGERRLPEVEADWLPGYEGSSPVRLGNAAVDQLQLDIYGEVVDALHLALHAGIPMEPHEWRLLRALMDYLERHWQEPDEGIWEVRGQRRHFVHSKVMTWVAADRALRMAEATGLPAPLDRWRAMRNQVHRQVCERGWNEQRGAFTQFYGGHELDAAVLYIAKTGFLPPDDPRLLSTVDAVRRELDHGGFLRRYEGAEQGRHQVDGLTGLEGAFLACSFWLADAQAIVGKRDEAAQTFERALGAANDVGLLSEQWDPEARRQLGNTPQAFSHVALVNAALTLTEEGQGAEGG